MMLRGGSMGAWSFIHRDIFETIILDDHRIITGGATTQARLLLLLQ